MCFFFNDTATTEIYPLSLHDALPISRAQLNTEAQALVGGEAVARLQEKWLVVGLKPPSWTDPFIRVQLDQMPPSYQPVGRVVANGYASYSAATEAQKVQAGWATLPNGRVVDAEADSNISYVG